MEPPVIILVRPQMAENIGMAARAMANFGLAELRLVAPRDGWPQKTRMKKGAHQAASGATHILESAGLFDDVPGAIGDLIFVFATTARERGQAKPVFVPEDGMAQAMQRIAAGQRIGILFGPERTGLENDEVSLADAVLTFPVSPDYPSLNLAQAVLLVGYEWRRASAQGAAPFQLPAESGPAPRAMLLSFFDYLEGELKRVKFFHPEERAPVMVRNFRNILHKVALTEQDVRTLRGAITALITGGKSSRHKTESDTDNPGGGG